MKWNEEIEQRFMLCVSTYINLYGVMPSTKEMCRQLGFTNAVLVSKALEEYRLPSLLASA